MISFYEKKNVAARKDNPGDLEKEHLALTTHLNRRIPHTTFSDLSKFIILSKLRLFPSGLSE